MLYSGLTPASLAGALAYLATAGIALIVPHGQWGRRVHSAGQWRLVGIIFLALAGWRLGLVEIRLQDDVRAWARGHGLYDERHGVQGIVTVAILALVGAGVAWLSLRGWPSRSRLALIAALGLVLLSLGRLASLHALDELLYRTGPIHLNYVIDLGLTAWAGLLAWLEIAAARGPRPHGTRRRETRS